ncbi:hypothetical protein V7S43_010250 [Phytophthora oleae]|uniref:Apple domain-containing protein n=1 Tax=Phytophthora oleae TaxID=2107226 RepID=A0ABD3FCQ1_9STRA
MLRDRWVCRLHVRQIRLGRPDPKGSTGIKKNVMGAVSAAVASRTVSTEPAMCGTENGGYCGNSRGTSCCPDKTYCQPWNPDYYQCKDVPDKCSTQLTDTDLIGNDISVSFGKYPWDCCDKCSQTSGCVGYTFVNTDPKGPACYLKSSLAGKKTTVGRCPVSLTPSTCKPRSAVGLSRPSLSTSVAGLSVRTGCPGTHHCGRTSQ